MLNNYRFLLYRPQNETQLQLSFFFSFSKLSLFIWLFVEERIAKGSHRWLYLLQFGSYGGLKTNQRWNKSRFRKHFSHSIRCLEYWNCCCCCTCFIEVFGMFWLSVVILQGVVQHFSLSRIVSEWHLSEMFKMVWTWRLICTCVCSLTHIVHFCRKYKNIEIRDLSIIYRQTRNFAKKTSPFWNTLYFVDTFIICSLSSAHI